MALVAAREEAVRVFFFDFASRVWFGVGIWFASVSVGGEEIDFWICGEVGFEWLCLAEGVGR